MTSICALIMAAGSGRRFGTDRPKQYHLLDGRSMLRRCIDTFRAHPAIDRVRVVIHPDHARAYAAAIGDLSLGPPIVGGATRRESVRRGLEALAAEGGIGRVLIHDAARPGVDAVLIDAVLAALETHPGALPVLALNDTLKRVDAAGLIRETVPRAGLYRAQTPQGFDFGAILAAHRAACDDAFTDDAAIAEAAGMTVATVPGSPANEKITLRDDLDRYRIRNGTAMTEEFRVGTGHDAHRFAEDGDHCMLCGIAVPHDRALIGHSDADVGLHALSDALLGAIAAGDIGEHFPSTDPQWRDVSSDRFLAHAAGLVRACGGRIVNVDVTLICERPRVGPHRDAMRARIAAILEIAIECVAVKATTTDMLGFTGRREGIAAQAAASVAVPYGKGSTT